MSVSEIDASIEAKTERLSLELEQSRARTAALSKELSEICKHDWRLDGRQNAAQYGQRCPLCLKTRWATYPDEAQQRDRLNRLATCHAGAYSNDCVIV